MPLRRRHAVRNLAIASAALMSVACYAGLVVATTHLWECNYCH
jgi:hypothetical protein